MSTKDDGGQAFPMVDPLNAISYTGMTLRDYFAAAAMQGHIASPDAFTASENIAAYAYKVADAMLKERQS